MDLLYTANIDSDCPVMWIDKHIGMDDEDGPGIIGDLFNKELQFLDTLGKRCILVKINSVGGLVVDGYSIINAILTTKTPVDTECIGIAGSISGVIFQTGRKRIMADYGILMYHNPGNAGDKALDAFRRSIIHIVSQKSGMDENKVAAIMARTTFIDAYEAKEIGFCDDIISSQSLNTKYLRKESTPTNYWKECAKIQNKAGDYGPTNDTTMLKVTNKLKLASGTSEEYIVDAIGEIQNKLYTAESSLVTLTDKATDAERRLALVTNKAKEELDKANDKAKSDMDDLEDKHSKKLKDMEDKYAKMKTACDDYKEMVDKFKAEKDEAEDKMKTEKAENMVKEYARVGRISNDAKAIAKWVVLAKADMPGTKEMIEAIPLNKASNRINIKPENKGNQDQPLNAAAYNAQVLANSKEKRA